MSNKQRIRRTILLDEDVAKAVDKDRGLVPFQKWLEVIIKKHLNKTNKKEK